MGKVPGTNWFWLLIYLVMFNTCSGPHNYMGSLKYSLKDKIYDLDDTINLNDISSVYTLNDTTFCFLNPHNNYLYIINDSCKKLPIDYLDTSDVFVDIIYYNNDTLIVLNEFSIDLYINKILYKKTEINTNDKYSLTSIFPHFKPYFNPYNKNIFIQRYYFDAYERKFNLCKYSLEAKINLTNLHIDTLYVKYPKIYCEYDFGMLYQIDRAFNANYHFYSFPISEKVIKYNLHTHEITNLDVMFSNNAIDYKQFGSKKPGLIPENKIYNMFFQSPRYINIAFDKYRNYLYRFYMPENNSLKMSDRQLYLLIYDISQNSLVGKIKFSRKEHFTDIVILKNEILIPKNNFIYDDYQSKTDKLYYTSIVFN